MSNIWRMEIEMGKIGVCVWFSSPTIGYTQSACTHDHSSNEGGEGGGKTKGAPADVHNLFQYFISRWDCVYIFNDCHDLCPNIRC